MKVSLTYTSAPARHDLEGTRTIAAGFARITKDRRTLRLVATPVESVDRQRIAYSAANEHVIDKRRWPLALNLRIVEVL